MLQRASSQKSFGVIMSHYLIGFWNKTQIPTLPGLKMIKDKLSGWQPFRAPFK
jgi:hypothetical protein